MTMTGNGQPHVGIVSMGFPPLKHVAGLRASRFAEELVDLGARITVYTTSSPDQPPLESDHGSHIRVLRAPSSAMSLSAGPPAGNAMVRRTVNALRMFGDGAFGDWVRAIDALAQAGTAPADQPDVVWAIHGSDSTHALARRLSRRLAIPWIADYKDNWDLGKTGMAQTVARVAHGRRTSSAVALTAASRIGAQELEEVFDRPATAIYTGVDVESWRRSPAADLGPRFNIVFTGHATTLAMSTDVVGEGLVRALRALPADTVAVHYFGHAGAWLRTYLTDAGYGTAFVDHGFTDRPTVAAAQKGADLLLHLPYTEAPLICVKFLEYVASGRPILSVPEERDPWGSAEGIMSARAPDEMASTITELVERWRALGRQPSVDRDVSEYEWRPQAERLFALLVGVTRAGAARQSVPPS